VAAISALQLQHSAISPPLHSLEGTLARMLAITTKPSTNWLNKHATNHITQEL
jgi:hypothetical protein